MKFLADENFPGTAVESLREAGHDVVWIAAEAASISDRTVLARALEQARVLLTFDKDFGELAWKHHLPAQCGVVLFRCAMPAPGLVGSALAAMVAQRDDWPGHFSVIEDGRVRMRPLNDAAQ